MTEYKKYVKNPLPVTDKVWPKLLTLPCFNSLTDLDLGYIISQVKAFYENTSDRR
jgi:dTDP-4-amino-4,6-dideoxygalactose transaminase